MTAADGRVLLLTGPPGAGKTTVAQSLANRLDRAVHLECDRFFHFIAAGYIEPWRPEAHDQNTVVMQVVADAAARYTTAGISTIVDGVLAPGWFFEPVRDSLTAAGIEVSLAVLRPSVDTAFQRRIERDSSPVPREIVGQMWNDFADIGPLERHAMMNDAQDVSATVERVLDLWRRGLITV